MSDPNSEEILGPNSIGTDTRVIEGEVDRRVRPRSEVIAELRETARKRREQQPPTPPKDKGEPGTP
jgi:hypothetical protein